MRQLAVQYEVGPAAMTAAPSVIAGRGAPRRWLPGLPQATQISLRAERAAPEFAPRDGEARFSSYVVAACIAAGLVAAWLALCII
jgi:hypothetical protein